MACDEYGGQVWRNGVRFPKYEELEYNGHDYNGIIGSGEIKCCCYEQGLPTIYDGSEKVDYRAGRSKYEYEPFDFEYKGNRFHFESGCGKDTPYSVTMTEPDGTYWECKYDYGYGAGADYLNSENSWAAVFKSLLGWKGEDETDGD